MFKKISSLGKNLFRRETKQNSPGSPLLPLSPSGDKPIVYTSEAILFYLECAPVSTAINKIALEISSIPPRLYNPIDKKYVDDHPIFQLLKNPDGDLTYKEFMTQMIIFYLVTGNIYLRSTGMIENPPKELRIVPSQGVSIIAGFDGRPANYITRILSLVDNFDRFESIVNGQMRFKYYAGQFKELYHIRTFNPMLSSNMVYGISPLNPIFFEIRQYIESSIYNLSLLERGSKIGGLFKMNNMIPDEQRQRLEEQINRAMSGSSNAGRNILLSQNVDFQDLFKTARDMDYIKMRDQVTKAIYNALSIPLPLISSEHMILNNIEASKLLLYENAILPIAKRIFEELTNFLMPRYGEASKDLILTFNEKDISALEIKKNEQLNLMKESGIFTLNQLRAHYGAEPMQGGNVLYGQSMMVPVAQDVSGQFKVDDFEDEDYENSNENEEAEELEEAKKPEELEKNPIEEENEKNEENEKLEKSNKATKNEFVETMKLQINKDGSRRFSNDEIEILAQKHFD